MFLKNAITFIIAIIFTVATIGCSSNLENGNASSSDTTGSSQVSGGDSQVGSMLLRIAVGIAISVLISKAIEKEKEDKIEETIEDIINNN